MSQSKFQWTMRQKQYLKFKRVLDVVLSLLVILILFAPFLVVVLIQKLLDPKEPVFFVQERIGKSGNMFRILKLRSMKGVAEPNNPSCMVPAPETMTTFGRFLRESSIDEFPQFLQVLTGKMSIVGPRPLIPQEESIHRLREEYGVYQLRPGITGWAQVNGREKVKGEEKAALDREYMERIGFSMDAVILLRTIKAIFCREEY